MIALLLAVLLGGDEPAFTFKDVAAERGLRPAVDGIRGHAAGWGDVDGDGWPDLYVATFHNEGSKANQFFRNRNGRFELDGQESLRISTRSTASLFADFDGDGDLDLYVTSMPTEGIAPCALFRNDGKGRYVDVSKGNGACPADLAGRSAAVLDADGDGLLDLAVAEDPFGYGGKKSSRLFLNKGELRFEPAPDFPAGIPALGVAAGDVDNDGRPDLFLAGRNGGNRLLINEGGGRFAAVPGDVFVWTFKEGEDSTAGACFGDLNNDGLLDLVVGHHFKRPWMQPAAVRLYLNRGERRFEDVTEAAGLVALPMKAPHVELRDFDNDGRPDLYVSIVKFADGRPHPLIFRNLGVRDGLPRFKADALGVNDFPTAEDRTIAQTGKLFEKVNRERKIFYAAPGPSADFDRDGRLDLFLASWWLETPSLLLKNETAGGFWLEIEGPPVGSRVVVTKAGALLASAEVAIGYGYASGQTAAVHLGLGKEETVDVEVLLPYGKGRLVRKDVKAGRRLDLKP